MSKDVRQSEESTALCSIEDNTLTLFAFLWGVAAMFHVIGPSGAATQIFSHPTGLGFSHVLLALSAIWLSSRPRHNSPLIMVAILGLITAWQEAPILGNHWLLAAFVDIVLLLSILTTLRRKGSNRKRLAAVFLPLIRWCLILFYSFAAFSKLNSAFFDTAVSCSTYYFDETVKSLGLYTPPALGGRGLARLLPFLTAATEISIPLLLVIKRMRVFGVVLGLVFHGLIALDRIHPFIDFSSVLTALFISFLPVSFAGTALRFLKQLSGLPLTLWLAAMRVIVGAQCIGTGSLVSTIFIEGRMLVWYVFDAIVITGVMIWVAQHRRQVLEHPFTVRERRLVWLAVVPAVLVLNGLLPYFELRTAYTYTMYSNLRMVDGKSNHFIIRRSFPVANRQADLVKIVRSSDRGLNLYATYHYLLPWDSFRAYLAKHPEAGVIYERGNRVHVIYQASDQPELVTPPPLLTQKLLAMRAVDEYDPPRCQEVFLPAL
jgi:hypothetical protein